MHKKIIVIKTRFISMKVLLRFRTTFISVEYDYLIMLLIIDINLIKRQVGIREIIKSFMYKNHCDIISS